MLYIYVYIYIYIYIYIHVTTNISLDYKLYIENQQQQHKILPAFTSYLKYFRVYMWKFMNYHSKAHFVILISSL